MQPLTPTACEAGLAPPREEAPAAAGDAVSLLGLVELLLKDPERLDALNRQEARQAELMPRFLAIALASFALFGLALLLILHFAPAAAYPHTLFPVPPARLTD